MVAKLVNCEYNNFTFIYALPFNVNAKLELKIDDEINGGIDIEVSYSFYIMVLVLNDRM
jgi:flagellar assembly factor FliW